MEFTEAPLKGLIIIQPKVFGDSRGFFFESFKKNDLVAHGISDDFVQDNVSRSAKGTLRGLHYQLEPYAQSKLISVIRGKVFDVVVDIRKGSPTFGKWFAIELSDENHTMVYVPKGFAHGFCALSDSVDFLYKCGNYYSQSLKRHIAWDDPAIGIKWPIQPQLEQMSEDDKNGTLLAEAELDIIY